MISYCDIAFIYFVLNFVQRVSPDMERGSPLVIPIACSSNPTTLGLVHRLIRRRISSVSASSNSSWFVNKITWERKERLTYLFLYNWFFRFVRWLFGNRFDYIRFFCFSFRPSLNGNFFGGFSCRIFVSFFWSWFLLYFGVSIFVDIRWMLAC